MIYLSKLAKRLALAGPHAGLALFVLALAGACASPDEREFLSPNPSQPVPIISLSVEPKIGTAKPGEVIQFNATARNAKGTAVVAEVDWSASGGTISATGTFASDTYGQFQVTARLRSNALIADSAKVGVFVNPKDVLKLAVTPDGTEVTEGEGVQLEATAELADGSVVLQPALSWSADVGQVDGNGYFTAPENEGTYLVAARASSGVTATANVVVKPNRRNLERVEVAPGSVTLRTGQTQQFSVLGIWEDGYTKAISAAWSSTGGTITGEGQFTAGGVAGNFRVIARHKQGTQADTAFVSITEPEIVGLDVAPGSTSLVVGATQQFTATARLSDGTSKVVGATWEASGGSISAAGLYSAATAGSWLVKARVAGTTLAGEAQVNVSAPVATLTAITLNPSSATVPSGTTRQFSVTGTYSDGGIRTPSVAWSATGGTINGSGSYTAGTTLGTYRVIALSGDKADTSVVTVSPEELTSLSISPATVSLPPGATQQFSASGTWSSGSSLTPIVSWAAEGGTITTAGNYTAGTASGTYRVIGTHSGGRADTSLVTISPPAPTLVSLSLTPSSVSLTPSGTRQFSVSGSWTNGGTEVPPVTYTATGGTITPAGLYSAGSTSGTFRVVAKHTGSSLADTSSVVISSSAPTLQSITISPATTSLQTGGSRQFTVTAAWSDGSSAAPGVSWSATSGTISSSGLYLAPSTAGTYKVIVKESAGTKADTATVTVTEPVVVTELTVTPGSKSLATGATQQFAATATYSNGGTGTPSLVWSATGGTINATGLYTASNSSGNYRVIAQASGTSIQDTATVTLTSTTATVTKVVLSPNGVSLNPGGTSQFSLSPTWSDGATRSITPTYTATGGTVTSAGFFTAGQTVGTFLLIASCTGCTVSDTAAITISTAQQGTTGHPNQPAGYAKVGEEPFTNMVVNSVGPYFQKRFPTWWQDGTSSTPDENLLQALTGEGAEGTADGASSAIRIPEGWGGGGGESGAPGTWRTGIPSKPNVYAHFRFKLSSNYAHWQGSKIGYFYAGSRAPLFIALTPSGTYTTQEAAQTRPVILKIGLQGVVAPTSGPDAGQTTWDARPNLGTEAQWRLARNVWHDIEIQLVGNTPGVANGIFRMWLNGIKIMEFTNAGYFGGSYATQNSWSGFAWTPTHNGFDGEPYQFSVFQYMDHAYFSAP